MAELNYMMFGSSNKFFTEILDVVMYSRASTKKEEQILSIKDQTEANENFIKSIPNWTLVDKYIENKSGRKTKNRKEFNRLMNDARAGKFQLVILRDTSRFARNLKDTLVYIDELKQLNIGVYFIFENIYSLNTDDYQRLVLMALNAEQESNRKKDFTEMSINFRKAKKIPFLSAKTTGYTLIKTPKGQANTFKYNELSKLIAEIYFMYKGNPLDKPEGIENIPGVTQEWIDTIYSDKHCSYNPDRSKSLKEISKELNMLGVPTVFNSKYWHIPTISAILHKIVYTGYFMYNLTKYDDKQDKRKYKRDMDITISITEDGEIIDPYELLNRGDWLPIITLRDWLEIQNALRGNRLYEHPEDHPNAQGGKKPSSDIYVRRGQCGCCGAVFHKTQSRSNNKKLIKPPYLFKCEHSRKYKKTEKESDFTIQDGLYCDAKSFERVKLDYATIRVFDLMLGDLKEASKLAYKMIIENYVAQGVVKTEKKSVELAKEIAQVNKNISRAQQDLADGEIEYDDFKALSKILKDKKMTLEVQRAEALKAEGKDVPIKTDVFKNIEEALDRTLDINENLQEVDKDLISAFLIKLVASSTENCTKFTYFLDLTGEAYRYERVNFNCFDENYRDEYRLPENYNVFHSFTITKPEADEYAKTLNKRPFKSHVWNDIEVEIVIDYRP